MAKTTVVVYNCDHCNKESKTYNLERFYMGEAYDIEICFTCKREIISYAFDKGFVFGKYCKICNGLAKEEKPYQAGGGNVEYEKVDCRHLNQ